MREKSKSVCTSIVRLWTIVTIQKGKENQKCQGCHLSMLKSAVLCLSFYLIRNAMFLNKCLTMLTSMCAMRAS